MTTTTLNPQSTATLDLEATLNTLVDQHGLGAVGNALVEKHGRTAAIAAMLYPDRAAICSTSSDPSVQGIPASTISAAPPTF
ncbi:hypothetical protein PN498_26720 [Oscillatoria sp. CS-180]|uniref:hypothetical protein n=1 Tax=Oscillatoria sp. CS-180 TaxID=3021720 RepID=UPI00232E6B3A|nr:hypothetical protein [Oscillatoria sp. CS-180]MDB9529613.1 hypothetical protein [Oscillatoria sp. CS-180]